MGQQKGAGFVGRHVCNPDGNVMKKGLLSSGSIGKAGPNAGRADDRTVSSEGSGND